MSMSVVVERPDTCSAVIEELARALSVTMVETAKAQTYHWNVTGMAFGPLHALFQEIYEDHFEAQDTLAERIKALGGHADGRLSHVLELSTLEECDGSMVARQMVENLARDQRTLSSTLRRLAHAAEAAGDIVTNDLAIERAEAHDTFAWKLEAHLAD